jgi:hypothetical protein
LPQRGWPIRFFVSRKPGPQTAFRSAKRPTASHLPLYRIRTPWKLTANTSPEIAFATNRAKTGNFFFQNPLPLPKRALV